MKKTFRIIPALLIAVMSLALFSCSDDKDEPITYDQLPVNAKNFIMTYFGNEEIVSVTFDKDKHDQEYDVILRNGFELVFDKTGDWNEVNAPIGMTIPDGIAPQKIDDYIIANYPDYGINDIEKVKTGYEVGLTNGYELHFTSNGDFISLDM